MPIDTPIAEEKYFFGQKNHSSPHRHITELKTSHLCRHFSQKNKPFSNAFGGGQTLFKTISWFGNIA